MTDKNKSENKGEKEDIVKDKDIDEEATTKTQKKREIYKGKWYVVHTQSGFEMKAKELSWEIGTGYDLFASLYVLHNPAKFGLRASWAAGVRSRLPSKERETLERAQSVIRIPLHWLHSLQSEKNSISVLWAMEQILPAKRLEVLGLSPMIKNDFRDILVGVAERGSWNKDDQVEIRAVARQYKIPLRPKVFRTMLDLWSEPEEFGEDYLKALTTYHQVFFMEEERHIWSALEQAIQSYYTVLLKFRGCVEMQSSDKSDWVFFPLPVPTIIEVGVASPMAQGQAITSTAIEANTPCETGFNPVGTGI